MTRSLSVSSFWVVLGCGTHAKHVGANAATGSVVGPVKVEFAGVVQSTWKRQSRRLFVPNSTIGFGAPAGGGVDPSRSAGRSPPSLVPSVKHCCVAARPASILARSQAHISGPRNEE